MSRIGRLPITLDSAVKINVVGESVEMQGPKGRLEMRLAPGFKAVVENSALKVIRPGDSSRERALHGLMRKLLANMAIGVSRGFTEVLEINGVGYRAEVRGNAVHMTLGYSHPIIYQLPAGVSAKVDRQVLLTLESADRQLLGEAAAQIRGLRPPEPYKGKGIKYATEVIKRKAGKAAVGATAS